MPRTKNANVSLTETPPEANLEEVPPPAVVESEATDSISNVVATDSNEETEALQPFKMYFSPSEYTKPFKISAKCYIHKVVGLLETHLRGKELRWFKEHPQFRHFFHMHRDANHKLMGMWLLFLRTACLEKKREVWFIVNGVPIRYSLKEFALMSGLYCHQFPKSYETKGSMEFVGRIFGVGATIKYQDVEGKFLSMKRSSDDRLRVAVLYFLSSIIVGKTKTGEKAPTVEKFFQRVVADLDLCETFPWGRYAFDENLKDIFYILEKCEGVVGPQKVFPSFVMPLELLAFESIPVLKNTFCVDVGSADPKCPRMCKTKFKPSTMKGFPMSDVYDKLGTTKDIQSILTPSPDEEKLLKSIMDVERGWNDKDDVVADGWHKRLVDEGRSICFEEKFNEDVGNRRFEEAVIMPTRKGRRGKKGKEKVTEPPNDASSDGLAEIVYTLKTTLENGFKDMHEKMMDLSKKYEDQDTRLKTMEATIQSIQVRVKSGGAKEKEAEINLEGNDEVDYSDKEDEVGANQVKAVQDESGKDGPNSEDLTKENEGGEKVMENEMEKEGAEDDEIESEMEIEDDVDGGLKEVEAREGGEIEKESDVDGGTKGSEVGEKEKEIGKEGVVDGGTKGSEVGEKEKESGKEDEPSNNEKILKRTYKRCEKRKRISKNEVDPKEQGKKADDNVDEPRQEDTKRVKLIKKNAKKGSTTVVYRSPIVTRTKKN
ncbi:uncharacterized protein At3g43530-like isoform X2 [Arabidopsis lyrata subsp. lyrata]|nr:uncharacterized protein At3g43530-like isoform X2 [Arabidopsis lyrata subsp. lyrata]|eukprot:XP_020879893.1 uncharacterized protein At3g43530-like isoform X2 [Arabidopsis lyrata subsp. lyrata]